MKFHFRKKFKLVNISHCNCGGFFGYIYVMIEIIISDYINYIKDFEILIREKHHLNENERTVAGIGTRFERKGIVGEYNYWFHGSGCSLEINETECHYNYFINNITFSIWNFRQFIVIHTKTYI
ncbi:hypothetical protein J3D55_000701 [Chryseobacterium ginsenosidimutans]|uniref:DUF6896 domain-containing protein n=1 Tax=Chryseobacterium ginsenosidimutans TaxID=687846 RepID=UPI00216A8BB0|nr:hypothetical protein [Chryseobacterium ginsenosidimutans]MCS3867785.1 hypothetical protein [Chryseobacterium ginsenosidimutans]